MTTPQTITTPAPAPAPKQELLSRQDQRIADAVKLTLLTSKEFMPKNTARNYVPKQREWKQWCAAHFPPLPDSWPDSYRPGQTLPGDLVDEGKLLLFMRDEVVNRAPKTGKRLAAERKRKAAQLAAGGPAQKKQRRQGSFGPFSHTSQTNPDGNLLEEEQEEGEEEEEEEGDTFHSELKLQYNSIRGYISAIQKLFEEQQNEGMNPAPRPQGLLLKTLKQGVLRQVYERHRAEFADMGEGTLRPAHIARHSDAAWRHRNPAIGLRTNVDFLLGNHMLLRSGNRRPLELADCFCLGLPNEGVKDSHRAPTRAFLVLMKNGKTNQHGRTQYGSCLRHRDPQSCLVGQLAFWFFWRWEIEKEPFPSFAHDFDWYPIKVLRRSLQEPTEELSYNSQKDWAREFYNLAGITTTKVTHAPRVSGAQNADIKGVSEAQVYATISYFLMPFLVFILMDPTLDSSCRPMEPRGSADRLLFN